MKNHNDNTNALPALLRTANDGDTLEINSLCCVAAGIIAPLSATAEALIPHEKLRGAALADATLNAQERPLAQPVVGYTTTCNQNLTMPLQLAQGELLSFQISITTLKQFIRFLTSTTKTNDKCVIPLKCSGRLQKAHHIQDTLPKLEPQKCPLLICISNVVSDLAQKLPKIHLPPALLNFKICLDKGFDSLKQKIKFSHKKENTTRQSQFFPRRPDTTKTLVCRVHHLPYQRFMPSLNLTYPQSSNNCSNRSDSLHPGRSIIGGPASCNEDYYYTCRKRSQWRKRDHQDGLCFNRYFSRNHQWLRAITQSRILNNLQPSVYGGAA